MPGEVEKSHRNPRVEGRDAGNDPRRKPILPRTGEQREIRRLGEELAQTRRNLVGVFAHACAFAQGRPIVEENAHRGVMLAPRARAEAVLGDSKSLSVNRLIVIGGCASVGNLYLVGSARE